jgi:hypothetical protein
MPFRIQLNTPLALNRAIDFFRRNGPLFNDSMSHNGHYSTVEEIQDPVMNTLQTHPQFMNSISQQIRFRPPEFMSQFAQPFQPKKAFRLHLHRLLIQPFQEWA